MQVFKGTQMKVSLRIELIFSFTILGMILIGILYVFVNFFLESQFREYSVRKQELQNREIAGLVERQFDQSGKWHSDVIEEIGIRELEQGLILKVTDLSGRTIWDAVEYNSGICHSMIEKMSMRMMARYPSINGGLAYKDYPLFIATSPAGNLRIGYYGPFFYTDTDFFFIDTINRILVWLALGTLAASIAGGIFVSSRLATPIAHAIRSAKKIQEGDFSARPPIRSSTREVSELVLTMNTLAKNLGDQDQLRRQLTQDVAHELRTPLMTLQSHFEAMIDGVWEPTKERLTSLHAEVIRLAELVKNIQTLTHYESEAFVLEKTEFSVKELADRILMLHEPDIRSKKLVCTVDAPGDAMLFADRDKIAEVITNLLENAIEFTPDRGSIALRFTKDPDAAMLTVTDTGDGIPAADLPFIFERFYRADKSRARTTGGAGIGLAIVKQIVSSHGGTIEAASVLGHGSEFTVRLPQ
jgi:two-component system, OmpR family, sensor histidine kinase BaeS